MDVNLRRTYQERIKKFQDDMKGGQNLTPVLVAFMETVDRQCKATTDHGRRQHAVT